MKCYARTLGSPQVFPPYWNERLIPSSRVMVSDEEGPPLARGFVQYNLCCILLQSAIVQAGGTCVLNGLFVMEKGELHQGVHVHRLIVNLIPTNTLFLCVKGGVETLPLRLIVNLIPTNTLLLPVKGGVETLPLLPHMNALELASCAPKVLPMGFINSVGIARRLHQNLLRKVQGYLSRTLSFSEIRRDRSWTLSNPKWRVHLDNLDLLFSAEPSQVELLEGKFSEDMRPLVEAYHAAGIPLNEKTSVKQESFAEIQGAEIDGKLGTARPKAEKLGKYASATASLLSRRRCAQKELQVVSGGLVCFAMFRRPLMSCLTMCGDSFNHLMILDL